MNIGIFNINYRHKQFIIVNVLYVYRNILIKIIIFIHESTDIQYITRYILLR